MSKRLVTILVMSTVAMTSACATEPMSVSHQHVTPDKSHWSVQIAMHTGVPNTPIQTVMVLYNKYQKTPIATVSGQTKPLGEKLADDFLHLASTAGVAAIAGRYILKAAEADCPTQALCGTLVQVSNQAGANADSTATSNQSNTTQQSNSAVGT